MTTLPPNQFYSGGTCVTPDEAAVPSAPKALLGTAADICDIGEIFIGAAKIEPVETWFENTAYPREDELLYEVLQAMDDPHTADLIEMPYGFEYEFDEPPLFIQEAMRA